MEKPKSYDEVNVSDFVPVELGGHYAIIKKVEETQARSGKPMLKVYFDFDKDDVQPGYMAESFKADIRPDKKWPYAGTKWILTEDEEGKCSRALKKFITAFEKSNGCTVKWGEKFCDQFKNKRIGCVFGEVEDEYNGKVRVKHEHRWWCQIDKVASATIPERQTLSGVPVTDANGFMNIPDGQVEELPF